MTMYKYLEASRNRFGDNYIKSGDDIRYNCPFCEHRRGKADTDMKLYVSMTIGVFHCFKCGAKGHFDSKRREKPSSAVYQYISDYVQSSQDSTDDDNIFYIPTSVIRKGTVAYDYCMSRGITQDIIDYYDIRLGIDDLYGRIVIPNQVFGDKGIWTDMYSSRTYINQIPKYKNPSGAKKTNAVFNLHRINEGCDDIYGVEGAITAIGAGKNAVAFYGCHPSDHQILSVASKRPKNFYACLDNDAAGRGPNLELAEKMSKLLINGNVFVVYMPEGQDAADLGEQRFIEYVKDNRIAYHSNAYKSIISYFNN